MRVRPASAGDIPAIMGLERQSSAAHWSQHRYEDLLQSSSHDEPQHKAWVIENEVDSGAPKIPGASQEILAFLIAHKIDAEWELENIVVAGRARRRGMGTELLKELIAQARSAGGSAIFLEVRQSNHGARSLYRRMGFEETGLRKGYYSDPPEDAILCRLSLCQAIS